MIALTIRLFSSPENASLNGGAYMPQTVMDGNSLFRRLTISSRTSSDEPRKKYLLSRFTASRAVSAMKKS